MADKEKSLNEIIVERANKEQLAIATVLIEKAKAGDATAIKALGRALDEANEKSEEIEKFPLSDEQFNRIILIRAKRITGVLTGAGPALEGVFPARIGEEQPVSAE